MQLRHRPGTNAVANLERNNHIFAAMKLTNEMALAGDDAGYAKLDLAAGAG